MRRITIISLFVLFSCFMLSAQKAFTPISKLEYDVWRHFFDDNFLNRADVQLLVDPSLIRPVPLVSLSLSNGVIRVCSSEKEYSMNCSSELYTSLKLLAKHAVGNSLEVKEAIDTLHGHGPKDFQDLCYQSGAIMLEQAGIAKSEEEGLKMLHKVVEDGSAFEKLRQMVIAQGGDVSYIDHPEKFPLSKHIVEVKASKSGYIKHIVALEIGESAMRLGAGRETFDDVIDMSAGIVLNKKVGDKVEKGETLCVVHTNKEEFASILKDIENAFDIVNEFVPYPPTVHDYIKG